MGSRAGDGHGAVRWRHEEGSDIGEIAAGVSAYDLDGDGRAEVLLTRAGSLSILDGADGPFAAGRPTWNQHGWAVTNVEDDAGIPSAPEPSWQCWNTFRAGRGEP